MNAFKHSRIVKNTPLPNNYYSVNGESWKNSFVLNFEITLRIF